MKKATIPKVPKINSRDISNCLLQENSRLEVCFDTESTYHNNFYFQNAETKQKVLDFSGSPMILESQYLQITFGFNDVNNTKIFGFGSSLFSDSNEEDNNSNSGGNSANAGGNGNKSRSSSLQQKVKRIYL